MSGTSGKRAQAASRVHRTDRPDSAVAAVLDACPKAVRTRLLALWRLILDTARTTIVHALAERLTELPTDLPAGIEASDDPVLHFRSQAYIESKRRRARE